MRNLCILVNSLASGGGEKVAYTLSDKFRKMGINVFFVCLEKNNFYKIHNDNVYYLSNQTGKAESVFKKLFFLFIFALRLKKFIKIHEISIVQSHIYRANYVNILAKLFGARHKTQLVNHGIASRYKTEGLAGFINLWLVKYLYGQADQVICPSNGMMYDLKNVAKIKNEIEVIHNPFDVREILRRKETPLKSNHLYFASSKKYLITVGRMEKVKRFQDIIIAVDKLVKGGLNVELIILGDGPEKSNLTARVEGLNLQCNVHMPGRVENPFQYVSRSDILISASEYEGFSNVIVEALICGTPVISTDCPSGPREILAPDMKGEKYLEAGKIEFAQYGVLVPVQDPQTLAEAVRALLEDPRRRAQYAEKGILRAREFDTSVIAEKYIQKISALMD